MIEGSTNNEAQAALSTRARKKRERYLALAFLMPSLIVFGSFVYYPLIRTIQLGAYSSDPFGNLGRFVGIDQYIEVLKSSSFQHSFFVTLQFAALTVPTGLILGTGLAVLANIQLRGIQIFRVIFSSTVASSVAIASLMWITLLNPSVGLVNQLLTWMGHDRILFLQDPTWAMLSVSAATVWLNLGFTFIVVSAGLQAVPEELLESAAVDGAGPVRRFWQVTLPMLSPTMFFAVIVLGINAFQSFGQIDLLTSGGPLGRTNVMVYSIFTLVGRDPSVAAAQAVVLFLIMVVLSGLQLRFMEHRVVYES